MKAVVAAFNQEKALVGAFSVIVQPVVEPMDRFAALLKIQHMGVPHLPRQPVFVISDFPTIITVYYIHHLVDEYECNAMK